MKERIFPTTFILWIKEIQEEGRWMPLFDLDFKTFTNGPQKDNAYACAR